MSTRDFSTSRLSIERLREVLIYNRETGVFTWRTSRGSRSAAGSIAGCLKPNGYVVISIDYMSHQAHRLALYWVNGVPSDSQDIDHADQNKSNNAFANLREATSGENRQNTGVQSNNKSGFKGVSWNKRGRKWKSEIGVAGKTIYLGDFTDIEDAIVARKAAEIRFHPFRPTVESP